MTGSAEQHIQALERHLQIHPTSPLFAQLANHYLEGGRAQEALALCDQGLAQYPHYTTGHLIKGKSLLALKMYAEAKREFELVREFLPFNHTVAELLAKIPADADLELTAPPSDAPAAEQPTAVVEEPTAPEPTATEPLAVEHATEAAAESSPFDQLQPPPDLQPQAPAERPEAPEDAFAQLGVSAAPGEAEPAAAADDAFGGLDAFSQLQSAEPTSGMAAEVPQSSVEPESPFAALEGAEMIPPSTENASSPFGIESGSESATQEPPGSEPSPFDFGGPSRAESAPTSGRSPFEEIPPTIGEEESFEQYAARMRAELAGTEETMSFEEYLGGNGVSETESSLAPDEPAPPPSTTPEPPTSPAAEGTDIESLTEKLQTAKKITPIINLADRTPRPTSDAETPASTGFVTPTLAEIYAKQGWYDDAIKAYRTLIVTKPAEKEKFEKRIKELEELKAQQNQGS
ncbi:MAG TPA: tetratricopeptide repeat protein [Bacteroidota bacterium]|nr:tetratricopeptide repeat protein [Bacteroidota bacterium]